MKTSGKRIMLWIFLCCAGMALNSHGAVIATYNIQATGSVTSSTSLADTTASALTHTGSVSAAGTFLGTNAGYVVDPAKGLDLTIPTISHIITQWNIAPDSGFQLTLENASNGFRVYHQKFSGTTGTSTVYGKLFVASDAAFSNILAESSIISSTFTGNATGVGDVVYTSIATPLVTTGTLYFGFATTSTTVETSSGVAAHTRYDDFRVNGTVAAIPEPSAAMLLGVLGLLFLLFLLRRRRHV